MTLVRLLQAAHAGERAAAVAYAGHAWSLRREPDTAAWIRRLADDEWRHRAHLRVWLRQLGARPSWWREAAFLAIGLSIAAACPLIGRFLPMLGAGLIERANSREYERLAAAAEGSALHRHLPRMRAMAGLERLHEAGLRAQARRHPRAWACATALCAWAEPTVCDDLLLAELTGLA